MYKRTDQTVINFKGFSYHTGGAMFKEIHDESSCLDRPSSHSGSNYPPLNPHLTMGQLIYDLGNKQWDIPKLRELLENILPQKIGNVEFRRPEQ